MLQQLPTSTIMKNDLILTIIETSALQITGARHHRPLEVLWSPCLDRYKLFWHHKGTYRILGRHFNVMADLFTSKQAAAQLKAHAASVTHESQTDVSPFSLEPSVVLCQIKQSMMRFTGCILVTTALLNVTNRIKESNTAKLSTKRSLTTLIAQICISLLNIKELLQRINSFANDTSLF